MTTDPSPDSVPDDDTALSILGEIAKRADAQGLVRLYASEIPFFTTTGGSRWLEQVSLDDDSFRITDLGRSAPCHNHEDMMMSELAGGDEQHWAEEFAVTVEQIRDAVRAVGPEKADVEMYLKGSHSSTDADAMKRADS